MLAMGILGFICPLRQAKKSDTMINLHLRSRLLSIAAIGFRVFSSLFLACPSLAMGEDSHFVAYRWGEAESRKVNRPMVRSVSPWKSLRAKVFQFRKFDQERKFLLDRLPNPEPKKWGLYGKQSTQIGFQIHSLGDLS